MMLSGGGRETREGVKAQGTIDGISVEPDATLPSIEKHDDSQSAALGGAKWVID